MGHRHSTLHSQLKQQDGGGPNCDLVTAPIDGASTSGGNSGLSVAPYLEVKKGPFKRRLSMRSISIRRSFHKPKKNSTRIVSEPTTASVVQTSSCSNSNGASAACSSALASNGSTLVRSNSIGNGHAQQVTMLPRSSKTGEKVGKSYKSKCLPRLSQCFYQTLSLAQGKVCQLSVIHFI